MPFPTSRAGSTVDSTPTTSGEDEEDLNFHRRAFAKLMRTTEMRRKRLAESDSGDLSVSIKPATKRRAAMTAVYVDIPVLSTVLSTNDKGKGRAPSNLVAGLEDGFLPTSEAGLEYDELVTLQGESDHRDSDFDANDEDEEDRDITLRSGRKFLYKRTSCAAVDDLEEEEVTMFDAAIKTSIRNTMNGGGLTRKSSNGDIRAPFTPAAVVHRFVVGNGFEVDSNVVPDSDIEGGVLVLSESEDGTIMQPRRTDPGKDRCRDKRQATTKHDAGGIHHSYFSEGRERGLQARWPGWAGENDVRETARSTFDSRRSSN